jgi:hypothetical protein
MSNPAKPAWPDPSALPFMLFGAPTAAPASAQPQAQGADLFKQFWGSLPGGSSLPGFLVPTIDVEELDKRVSDLRAAEKWLEVNLTMLRATIQGLEVQRNTIAAISSLSAMADSGFAAKLAAQPTGGLPAAWPGTAPSPQPAVVASPSSAPEADAPAAAAAPAAEANASPPLAGLATSKWLGFMQDQFSKVAQAALAGSSTGAAAKAVAPARKTGVKALARKAKRRPAASKKTAKAI